MNELQKYTIMMIEDSEALQLDVSWDDDTMELSCNLKVGDMTLDGFGPASIGELGDWLPRLLRGFYLAGMEEARRQVRDSLGVR